MVGKRFGCGESEMESENEFGFYNKRGRECGADEKTLKEACDSKE